MESKKNENSLKNDESDDEEDNNAFQNEINTKLNTESSKSNSIQQHLKSMFYLLRREETLKMAVKLESHHHPNRTRYLAIATSKRLTESNMMRKNLNRKEKHHRSSLTKSLPVPIKSFDIGQHEVYCSISKSDHGDLDKIGNIKVSNECEESCLLGIDCNDKTTIGLVLPILADTSIRLDGDGGFSVTVYGKTHIFKPVSVQAMWSAIQTLHKVSQKARQNNFYPGGPSHEWLRFYQNKIKSEQSCLNEWNTMDSIESRRPPSPDAIRNKPTQKEEAERIIIMKLKEIMMSVDLDEVTSKYIRGRLEELLDMDLGEYKSFIDREMLTILGQMDAPTKIFDHVYLGSEWNASNFEELQKNGVRHIINVTREIDNFFPGIFNYFNIRVYDDDKTNLLKYWDNTYKYITRAKSEGSKVLVHCKMGVSRSASVVIAYAMKAYNWNFNLALEHVKKQRSCIKPNKNFLAQLETYNGMLDAMKNKDKLQRSKSETNLKANTNTKDARLLPGSEPTPLIQALNHSQNQQNKIMIVSSPKQKNSNKKSIRRGNSMSPKRSFLNNSIILRQQSQSLESLTTPVIRNEQKNVRYPCSNGQNYSVTQNQILEIQKPVELMPPSVKTIVKDLESKKPNKTKNRKSLDLHIKYNVTNNSNNCFGRSVSAEDNNNTNSSPLVVTWSSSAQLIHQLSTNEPINKNDKSHKRKQESIPSIPQNISNVHLPSRHSSWGSGDNRSAILPTRNNSFGSYDIHNSRILKSTTINKPISQNSNVMKQVNHQHIRCNSEDFCTPYQTNAVDIHNRPRSYDLCFPSTEVFGGENNGNNKTCSSLSSNVQILKQSFEAKAKGKSLPSSPIATHTSPNIMNPTADHDCNSEESHDFTVQGLVSKYQMPGSLQQSHVTTTAATTNRRPKSFYETNLNTVDSKYKRSNSLRSNNNRSQFQNDQDNIIMKKPPPFMSVLPQTITTNFTQTPQTVNHIRQQHGKTHPLSKLSHRIKTAAFNTM
ncbi:SSH3 family protein [Megaselia abdita]